MHILQHDQMFSACFVTVFLLFCVQIHKIRIIILIEGENHGSREEGIYTLCPGGYKPCFLQLSVLPVQSGKIRG